MNSKELKSKIKKLYTLLERTRQQMLGLDWESKLELKNLESKVVSEIKRLEQQIKSDVMVK